MYSTGNSLPALTERPLHPVFLPVHWSTDPSIHWSIDLLIYQSITVKWRQVTSRGLGIWLVCCNYQRVRRLSGSLSKFPFFSNLSDLYPHLSLGLTLCLSIKKRYFKAIQPKEIWSTEETRLFVSTACPNPCFMIKAHTFKWQCLNMLQVWSVLKAITNIT